MHQTLRFKNELSINLYLLEVSKTYVHNKYLNSCDHHRACFGPAEDYIIAGNSIIPTNKYS